MKIELDFVDNVAGRVLDAFGAPGLSIAVFVDGAIVSRAYGLADSSSGEALAPGTAFTVGSPTKSFTAVAMAILREEGRLDWDDPVSRFVPDLCNGAGEQGKAVTVCELLSHQSGFGWHDPLWYNSPWDRASVIRKAWRAGPAWPRRSRFQYCNLTYMMAGEIVSRVSGVPYEQFVRTRIFAPLGLHGAHFAGEPGRPGIAQPHTLKDGVARRIPLVDLAKANAACGLRISAPELAIYLSQFCGRAHNGIPRSAIESVTAAQVAIGRQEGSRFYTLFGQPDSVEYGFGWFLRRYRGHRVVFHTGRLPGAGSHVAVLPDLNFGIAALTNLTFACLSEAVTLSILDRFVGGPATDWLSYYREVSTELIRAAAPPCVAAPQEHGVSTHEDTATWVGDYVDPAYGRIQVRKRHDGLRFAWANYRGDLVPVTRTKFLLMNLDCPLLADGEIVEFCNRGARALEFLGRRFERVGDPCRVAAWTDCARGLSSADPAPCEAT